MKVICLQENFKKNIDVVERITGKNLNLPILNNILLKTEDSFLSFTSTDLELGIKSKTPVKIEKQGSLCVPAKILSNLVSNLPNEKVEIEIKDKFLSLKCGKYRNLLKYINSKEFPIIPQLKKENIFNLNGRLFAQKLSQVVNITSISDFKPEISGVFISLVNDEIKLVATDTFRLAEQKMFLSEKVKKDITFIIPQRTCQEFIRIFGDYNGKVGVVVTENQILFENQGSEGGFPIIQITSRLIEGEYPNYESIIPEKPEAKIWVSRNDFLKQIKVASLFSSRVNDVKIKIDPKTQEIEIFAQDPEFGESKSVSKAKIEAINQQEVSFNYKYILDGLNYINDDEVFLGLNGYSGPGILKPSHQEDYIYIVMPIKSV